MFIGFIYLLFYLEIMLKKELFIVREYVFMFILFKDRNWFFIRVDIGVIIIVDFCWNR